MITTAVFDLDGLLADADPPLPAYRMALFEPASV